MTKSERRRDKRTPIRVLVNCIPPGTPSKRNGHPAQGWEMWASDLGDNGVRLEWSLAWAVRDYAPNFRLMDERPAPRKTVEKLPNTVLKKGSKILLDGLVYGDRGSKPMKGLVQWAKPGKKAKTYEFGVLITSPDRKSYFRALAA